MKFTPVGCWSLLVEKSHMSELCCIKVFLYLQNWSLKLRWILKRSRGTRPVTESLYSDRGINACVRMQKNQTLAIYVTRSKRIQNTAMVTAAVNTLTHAVINKEPLWIFSRMSGEALGQTTASKHGSDRTEEDGPCRLPTHADGRDITVLQALVQAGTNNISFFVSSFFAP